MRLVQAYIMDILSNRVKALLVINCLFGKQFHRLYIPIRMPTNHSWGSVGLLCATLAYLGQSRILWRGTSDGLAQLAYLAQI
jgi:hypothetical protein